MPPGSNHRSRSRSRFRRLVRKRLSAVGQCMLMPVQLLFWPLELVNLFHRTGVQHRSKRRRNSRSSWKRFQRKLVEIPLLMTAAPIRFLTRPFRRRRARYLSYFLPAIGVVGLVAFVVYQTVFLTERVQNRYFAGARRAMRSGNMELAESYFRRLRDRQQLSDMEALQWAFVMKETGDLEQYQNALDRLAPPNAEGFGPAHAAQALELASRLQAAEQACLDPRGTRKFLTVGTGHRNGFRAHPTQLKQLAFHLDHADDLDHRVKVARAIYLIHSGNVREAVAYLADVAQQAPELYLTIAQLGQSRGVDEEIREALHNATSVFQRRLRDCPMDQPARLMLAATYVQLGQLDDAEATIERGLELLATHELRQAMAELHVKQFDVAPVSPQTNALAERLIRLKSAIAIAPGFQPAYQRMVLLLREFGGPAPQQQVESMPLKRVLESMVTSGQPVKLTRGVARRDLGLPEVTPDQKNIDHRSEYQITFADGHVETGFVSARTPLPYLHMLRPPHAFTTDRAEVVIEGIVKDGAEVRVDGEPVAPTNGKFKKHYALPKVGSYQPTVVVSKPKTAPRKQVLEIRRVRDLARAAKDFEADPGLAYARYRDRPDQFRGRKVSLNGRVFHVLKRDGAMSLQMMARCEDARGCSIWVDYPVATAVRSGDWVRVHGTLAGEKKFRTEGGSVLSAPRVEAQFVLPSGAGK